MGTDDTTDTPNQGATDMTERPTTRPAATPTSPTTAQLMCPRCDAPTTVLMIAEGTQPGFCDTCGHTYVIYAEGGVILCRGTVTWEDGDGR